MSSTPLRPLAVQLYSVRDLLTGDYEAVIDQLAGINLLGVETAGLYFGSPAATAELCRTSNLQIVGAHLPLPLGDKRNEILDIVGQLGTQRMICPYIPPEEFASADAVHRVCDRLNEADVVARANGLRLYYHNHWWEYQRMGGSGEYPYVLMQKALAPTIHYEIDTYWVRVAGLQPQTVLGELADRVTLLHVKDGEGASDQPMLAVGDGIMNYHEVIPAAVHAEWLIIELDRCATDMIQAINRSAEYLQRTHLGRLDPA